MLEICGHHLHTEPRPPSDFSKQPIPADLEALVLACLAKQRDRRPSGAEELREALARSALGSPWQVEEARRFWRELGKAADSRAVRIRTDDRPSA